MHRLHLSANALAKDHSVATPADAFGLVMDQLKALRRVLGGQVNDPELETAKSAARAILSSEAAIRRLQGKTQAKASGRAMKVGPTNAKPKSRPKTGGRVHHVVQQADPRGRAWLDSILRRLTNGDGSGK
ncbi:MAG: hypothetical protein Q8K58_13575 [Acidimicrobiales bacterium]|nr:hypothetical protein [Acidimicrobiales bacterium]